MVTSSPSPPKKTDYTEVSPPKKVWFESQVASLTAEDWAGLISAGGARVEGLGADFLAQCRAHQAGAAVPCCSTAGAEWRSSPPPRAGSACPRTLPFPPLMQLGRNSPKPKTRAESSLCEPPQPAVPVTGQCCPFQLQLTGPTGPKVMRTSPRANPTVPLPSHSLFQ